MGVSPLSAGTPAHIPGMGVMTVKRQTLYGTIAGMMILMVCSNEELI